MSSFIAVLGGNTMAMPAVKHLRESGYKVIVLDKKPCADSYAIASETIVADLYNPSEVINSLKKYKLDAVMALNDFAVRSASAASKEFKLPGFSAEAAENVLQKSRMKKLWIDAGLKTAYSKSFNAKNVMSGKKIDWEFFPCILKPSFAGGASRGVYFIRSLEELRNKLKESLKFYLADEFLLEEYIEGTEHTVEVLIHDGNTTIISISDKKNYENSYTIVQKLYFPGETGHRHKEEITRIVDKACKVLGLNFGSAHFEIIISDNNVYLLEVGGRPGGGLNFFPIGYISTGYDYPLELARILSGKPPLLERHTQTYQLGWYFWSSPLGILKEVKGIEDVKKNPSVIACELLVREGQMLTPDFKNDMERPGYILVKGKDKKEVDDLINYMAPKVEFIVEF